jgi:hypothetical protein
MSLLLFLWPFIAFATDLPHEDPNFGCFSAEQAETYVRDFSIDVASFGGLELCDSRKDTKKLFNDLHLIQNANFGPVSQHPFLRGFVAGDYYSWMKGETRSVRRGHDLPYATAYNSFGHFTMQDGWAALSTLGRVGTIIHEARHTAGYRHRRCTFGPYSASNVSGCDGNYAEGGSHGVEMEYYARVVLDAQNLHPVYQSMARLMAMGRSNFVFNEQPMQKREGLLLVGQTAVLLDGGKKVREFPVPGPQFRLQRTSFGASFFDGRTAYALDLYATGGMRPGQDDYSYFKLFQIPRDSSPQEPVAVEEVDVGNLRHLAVLGKSGKLYTYNFPQGKWHNPSAQTVEQFVSFATTAPDGREGLFVRLNTGELLPVDLDNRRFGGPLKDRWPQNVVQFAKWQGKVLRLLNDGKVWSDQSEFFETAGEQYQQMISVPLYDAFEVVP